MSLAVSAGRSRGFSRERVKGTTMEFRLRGHRRVIARCSIWESTVKAEQSSPGRVGTKKPFYDN